MKKKYITLALTLLAMAPAWAQEAYEDGKIITSDLNGTARYVGMGGALDALGADISTISTNPAGIGLFRHSVASVSAGLVIQSDAAKSSYVNGTNASFDQIGFVYTQPTGRNSFVNFAFNYHKDRNFDYILSAAGTLNGASQNKLTYNKLINDFVYPNISTDPNKYVPDDKHPYVTCNQLDDIYARNMLSYTEGGELKFEYFNAQNYELNRGHKGYISEYDFNISGNIHDRVFLGITAGLHDVRYRHFGTYSENLVPNYADFTSVTVEDERRISGTGFDIKVGVIVRPIEESPFRIGLSVATPVWYDKLTSENFTTVYDNFGKRVTNSEAYDFKLFTPWKFGFSLGHTINNMVAIGAGVDYAKYSATNNRRITDTYYDWYQKVYFDSSETDVAADNHLENTLKGVCTIKVGAEVKPIDNLSLRLGYNYSSPMYEKDGFKDGTLESNASYISSATDYTNWKAVNRITCGVGYNISKFSIDMAYQFSSQKGDFKPFMEYVDDVDPENDIIVDAKSVKNERHQLLLTLGYHF